MAVQTGLLDGHRDSGGDHHGPTGAREGIGGDGEPQ
jgi:hypothetical protein